MGGEQLRWTGIDLQPGLIQVTDNWSWQLKGNYTEGRPPTGFRTQKGSTKGTSKTSLQSVDAGASYSISIQLESWFQ